MGERGPGALVDLRARPAARALRELVPGVDALAGQLAPSLMAMVEAASDLGRPPVRREPPAVRPRRPGERLWQLTTVLREFRGDAHAAALADHGLDAPEALVLAAATGRVPREGIQLDSGWSDPEWADAEERLRSRGLIDARSAVTARRAERDLAEDTTDRLAGRLLGPLAESTADALLPFPNPIGLPASDQDASG
ncbi:hypothetical protein AB0E67_21265 [Streptomyces sp. NPDC032161]|uniref:SCO6745 family protein n=1 Tax=unclassified Streptomyces TaxID=2593676 RepID=UPI0033C5AB2A